MPARREAYKRFQNVGPQTDFVDEQFEKPEPRVPVKSIVYALALFVVGSILLIFGSLLFTGTIGSTNDDRWVSMIVLGSLMFIPGSYHTYIAYQAWHHAPGFSFDDIPDFDT